jgi:hypothetical protein
MIGATFHPRRSRLGDHGHPWGNERQAMRIGGAEEYCGWYAPGPCEHPGCKGDVTRERAFAVSSTITLTRYYCGEHAPPGSSPLRDDERMRLIPRKHWP